MKIVIGKSLLRNPFLRSRIIQSPSPNTCVLTTVGTGDLARGFAKLYLNSAKKEGSEYEVVAVEPLDVEVSDKLVDCVPVVDLDEGVSTADVLFLAIPGFALKQFHPR